MRRQTAAEPTAEDRADRSMMRAARVRRYGSVEEVRVETIPVPTPGPGEVLIRVGAAAVNFPDLLRIAGRYQDNVPLPFTPGSECAGVVEAVGREVNGIRVGDRVHGTTVIGAFAEYVLARAHMVRPTPPGFDDDAAAAFGVAYGTAYQALRSVAGIRPGEWLVVLGAAGGVGLAGVDLGVQLGARVLAVAGGERKTALCQERGAHVTVDHTGLSPEELRDRIKNATDGGADVVLDPVGGPYSEPTLRATRRGGRFVVVGFAAGEIPRIPLNLVLLKGVSILGYEGRILNRLNPEEAARGRAEAAALLIERGIRPHISSRHTLDRVVDALSEVANRRALGKVIIRP